MAPKLLRPLLIVEFLIALQAVFTFWSQVGGQYHLDLMYWPWKFGIGILTAWLITAMTASLVRNEGAIKGRFWLLTTLFIATIVVAGCVTYFYHVNEPDEQDDSSSAQPSITLLRPSTELPAGGLTGACCAGS